MNIKKIKSWVGGLTLVFTGSMMIYFETYRNNQAIDVIAYGLLLFGWVLVFVEKTKGTSIAVFQFTANGKLITQPWYEKNEDDFKAGERYMVKYSVEYPEMFMIIGKLR